MLDGRRIIESMNECTQSSLMSTLVVGSLSYMQYVHLLPILSHSFSNEEE